MDHEKRNFNKLRSKSHSKSYLEINEPLRYDNFKLNLRPNCSIIYVGDDTLDDLLTKINAHDVLLKECLAISREIKKNKVRHSILFKIFDK